MKLLATILSAITALGVPLGGFVEILKQIRNNRSGRNDFSV